MSARPATAYVAPFLVLLLWAPLESRPELRPLYPWLAVAKAFALCTATATIGRPALVGLTEPLGGGAAARLAAAALLGAVGALLWVAIAVALPWARVGGDRPGFDPFGEIDGGFTRIAFLAGRGLTLVALVPIAEELFWRSFLPRYLDRRDFESIPPGGASPLALTISSVLYAATHPEWLAALAYAAMLCAWLRRTQSLRDVIAAHAATNLLLGAYVLGTAQWWLW